MTNSNFVLYMTIVSNVVAQENLDEQQGQRVLASMQREMAATAEAYYGEVVKSEGEDFMCHYSDFDNALNGAAAIMWAVESGTFPEAWQFSVKAGLCTIEEMRLLDDWSQLAELARPHQVLITDEVEKMIPAPSPFKVRVLPSVRINVHSTPVWEFRWRESEVQKSPSRTSQSQTSPHSYPALIIQFDEVKRIIQREGDTISIGRESSNDIVIKEDVVSRHHVHIIMRNGKAVLSDQSTNGTYIFPASGKPILLLRDQTVLNGNGKIAFEYANGSLIGSVIEYVVMLEQ